MHGWNLDDPRKWPHVILALATALGVWLLLTDPQMLGISPKLWFAIAAVAFLIVFFAGIFAKAGYPEAKAKAEARKSRTAVDETPD